MPHCLYTKGSAVAETALFRFAAGRLQAEGG